ncbi:MAG: UDP-N-acetyl-D-mannosamine dehydrogenase [Elusimicrobiales bacterium]|nr:UDP-N-acetyl-D-mannosamine dehydrogenase [Elusimicrobiales bacterium]
MRACFMGLGYIGLPTAVVAARNGIQVHGCDINPEIVAKTMKGELHFVEPVLGDYLKETVANGKLKASVTPEVSDTYLIVVPTPFKENHEPDIKYVQSASEMVLPLLKEGDLFIIESTSPVGTTELMAKMIFNKRPELNGKIYIAYCPERVLPGNIVYELEHNDRVIGGIDEASTEKAAAFYSMFVKGRLHRTNARTAEMCKLTENSSRDIEIAFANELSIMCDKAGINVWELINLANRHPRVHILRPGCGVGGHCIAVDPYFLTADFPAESQLISKAREVNNYKAFWCAEKIHKAAVEFENSNGRKPSIALMGLAFKPDIDDLRESPAQHIVGRVCQTCSSCELYISEPYVKEHKVFRLTPYREAYEKADIVVFLVGHKYFAGLSGTNAEGKKILDFCGITVKTGNEKNTSDIRNKAGGNKNGSALPGSIGR